MATDVRAVLIKLVGDNDTKKAFAGVNKSLNAVGKQSAKFAKNIGIATTAAAAALGVMITRAADAGDRIDKLSKQLGVSAKFLSELDHVANLSGTSMESLSKAVGRVGFNALQAEQGSKQATLAFEDLGVSIHDSNGELKDSEKLFNETLLALGRMENATRRGALAQTLFGRAGRELLPILADGEEGLQKMLKESKELGFVWSNESAASAAAFNDALTRVELIISGISTGIGSALMPRMTDAIEAFNEWFKVNREIINLKVSAFVDDTADSIVNATTAVVAFVSENNALIRTVGALTGALVVLNVTGLGAVIKSLVALVIAAIPAAIAGVSSLIASFVALNTATGAIGLTFGVIAVSAGIIVAKIAAIAAVGYAAGRGISALMEAFAPEQFQTIVGLLERAGKALGFFDTALSGGDLAVKREEFAKRAAEIKARELSEGASPMPENRLGTDLAQGDAGLPGKETGNLIRNAIIADRQKSAGSLNEALRSLNLQYSSSIQAGSNGI